jgi:hypothetical protein
MKKADPSIADSEAGRKIDLSEMEKGNALDWISLSFDPDSKVNDLSDAMPERAFSKSTVSDAGRQRVSRALHSVNVSDSMLSRLDSDSKMTDDRLEQFSKQNVPSIRTIFGIKIDFNEEQWLNADLPI